jgi:DNA-binding XRE family transcriptional regulator/predicted RNase H-like HicB family nuclease
MVERVPLRCWSEENVWFVQGLAPWDNVLTYGTDREDAMRQAQEALSGVLAALLDQGSPVPEVLETAEGDDIIWVTPDLRIMVPVWVRQAREAAGLTQGELATRLGVTYQAIQKWERPGANPTIETLQRVARAVGRPLILRLP